MKAQTLYPRMNLKNLDSAEAALKAALHMHPYSAPGASVRPAAPPFVTITRQAGAAGRSFGYRLADRLNGCCGPTWSAWDNELLEKLSAEHQIPEASVREMEERPHAWFAELIQNLPAEDARNHPDEFKVYKRVATTIRALAQAGHAIIVGRGGAFITSQMPGGIHVRLVAPLEFRIGHMAERLGVSRKEAADHIHQVDRSREAFYRRYWCGRAASPEMFTITLNSAELALDLMVDCTLPIIRARSAAPIQRAAEMTSLAGLRR